MNTALRAFVRRRAGERCEYCRLHVEDARLMVFHVEHIVLRQHGGRDRADNLCLACSECNWAKGPNLAGVVGGKLYPLFHPRRQNWSRHFRWDRTTLVGRTMTGRATVRVLNLNKPSRVMLRESLLVEGRFPPDE